MTTTGAVRAGKVFVEITADNAALERGLRAAQARLRAFGAVLREVGAPLAGLGGAVVGALLGAAKTFSTMGDDLDKMSARTGVSAEALSALGYAARLSGTDLETVETGLRKMQKTVTDAATGSSEAADALGRLGLGVQDVVKLKPEEQFKLIGDRLSQVADPTQRAALALELFGRNGTALLPMLAGGAKGLSAFAEEAARLGLIVSTDAAKDAARLNDELGRLWDVAKQGAFVVGGALAPVVTEYSEKMRGAIVAAAGWVRENRELVVTALKVAGAVAAVGGALVAAGAACRAARAAMGLLTLATSVYRGVALGAAGATAALNAALAFISKNPKVAVAAVAASVAAIGAAAYLSRRELDALAQSAGAVPTSGAPPGAGGAAPEVGADGGRGGGEDWARRVHQLRLQQIEDEHARAAALTREKYDHEISEAKRAGATIVELMTIAQAEQLELQAVATDAARKHRIEAERWEHELAVLRIEGIEDAAARERALVEENYRFRTLHAGPDEAAALAAQRAAELELADAHEAARLRQAAAEIGARDADRRATIAELELRAQYEGIELERKLLELQEQRAIAAAIAAGEDVDLVRREFELRKRLLDAAQAAREEREPTRSVMGTFSSAALFGLGLRKTEYLLGEIRNGVNRLRDDVRNHGAAFE